MAAYGTHGEQLQLLNYMAVKFLLTFKTSSLFYSIIIYIYIH